jgi:hypothetical protein
MKYIDNLEGLILANWWKCLDGEIKYLRKDIKVGTDIDDWNAWCVVHDKYLEEFPPSQIIEDVRELRKRIAILECDFVIENDTFLRNEIRRLRSELMDILENNSEGGLTREGFLIQLEKWIGFRINENEITARKYLDITKEFEREAEMTLKG